MLSFIKTLPKRILKYLILFYQGAISPYLPDACKYQPTCSEYAKQAVERFGALRGTALAVWRVLRCNPFSKGGYDPVPEYWGRKATKVS